MTCIIHIPFLTWKSFSGIIYARFPEQNVLEGYTTSQWIGVRDSVLQSYMARYVEYNMEFHSYELEFETEEDATYFKLKFG